MAKRPRERSRSAPSNPAAGPTGPIVPPGPAPVKSDPPGQRKTTGRPGRPKTRRQSHGSAWHWKQTDGWYYTLPGTKKRVPLFDEDGNRVRGKESRDRARLALARVKLA